jgi:predicted nuclease of restriction endonuclease-like RecB superfamily
MLTGKLVRVNYRRPNRIVPHYLDATDPGWLEAAERLLLLFRGQEGRTRGELEDDLADTFGNESMHLIHQGLAKLLLDRCEFDVASGVPPEELREQVFQAATEQRRAHHALPATPAPAEVGSIKHPTWPADRAAVLQQVAVKLGATPEAVEQGLFADLKSEQRLVRFKDVSAEHLLQRYNVALAQAVLLRSSRVHVTIRGEPPQRYRQLLRLVKFHRLVCEMEKISDDTYRLHLDGPLSLFTSTQKYGLQLALFLPAVLLCKNFDLKADLLWGTAKKIRQFTLAPSDGLVSHHPDYGTYVPPELGMFVEMFRKRIDDWTIAEETSVYSLGESFWVPDFRLVQKATGREVLMEVLGFWRRSGAEKHLERLRQHVKTPFLLAVSDQLHIDEAELQGLPAGIHRFRQMPLADEVARLAGEVLAAT